MERMIFIMIAVVITVATIIYYSLLITKVYKKEMIQFLLKVLNGGKKGEEPTNEPEDETGRTEIIIKSSFKNPLSGQSRKYPDTGNKNHEHILKSATNEDEPEDEMNMPLISQNDNGAPEIDLGGFTSEDFQKIENAIQHKEKLTEAEKEKVAETVIRLKDSVVYEQLLHQYSGFSELVSDVLNKNKEILANTESKNHKSEK